MLSALDGDLLDVTIASDGTSGRVAFAHHRFDISDVNGTGRGDGAA
ncbi:hypothetical protein [Micromonospora sp. NPDC005806]